jgi:hypothetical protein
MNDWQFYLFLVGLSGGGITIYFYGRKIGYNNLSWKHYAIIGFIFLFPTLILPMWFDPLFSFWEKAGITILVISVMAARYASTTKAQNDVAKWRDKRNQKNGDDY